ncbi:MAG: extracellular solute-binding protein [Proteobacteria bacterium]|nr:extracellular solute-binding protein [Pseudomonadota bacterium]
MTDFSRRDAIKIAAGTALAGGAAFKALLDSAEAFAQESQWKPEKGAKLRVLRWSPFVKAEGENFTALVAAFDKVNGTQTRIDALGYEDVRLKAQVAANSGVGPDFVWNIHADNHLYPEKLMDVTDVADWIGKRGGGWYPIAELYGKRRGRWNSIPATIGGNLLNYRISHIKKAGFEKVPADMAGFLKLMQGLKANGTPGGFAMGKASGDGNAWCLWLLWAFNGKVVDAKDNVALDSPETVAALEYAKQLAQTFVPGTASWLDPSNNKAFLDGQVSLTNNGISIYAAAKAQNMPQIFDDMDHAFYPIGPVGRPTEFHSNYPYYAYRYTKSPQACKALMAYLMDTEQYNKFLAGSVGYLSHVLKAYDNHPVWKEDPKRLPFKDVAARTLPFSWAGSLGFSSAQVFADFVVVDMFAEVGTGSKTPKQAAADAQKRAQRYYNT